MTLHRALAWTFGAFLAVAAWLDFQRGDGAVIAAAAWAIALVIGYRLTAQFVRGGW